MSRATFLRFSNNAINTGFTRIVRVAVFGVVCLGLSACVEGVDLPEFFSSMQEAGVSSQAGAPESKTVTKRKSKPKYVRRASGIDSRALLDAKGNWNIVEQGGAMDPTQAHKLARENVNVRRRGAKKELSAHFQLNAKSGEDGKMRVLRLERDGRKYGRDTSKYDLAESSVAKPSHTIAGSDLMRKIKALFGEEDEGGKSINQVLRSKPVAVAGKARVRVSSVSGIIIPGRKPSRLSPVKIAAKEEAHMIGGVVVPPSLPARKKVSVSHIAWSQKKPAVSGGVVRPRVKPGIKPHPISRAQPFALAQGRADAVKIRSGKHKGKTRLVIEVTEPTEYKVAIDHVRNVLRVKLGNTRWTLPPQNRFTKSALLGTYIACEQSDGSVMFEVRLKKQSKIIDTVLLRPNLSSKHRIVIDLKD